MARQLPVSLTGRLVFQLQAKSQEKDDYQFDKHLAIVKPLNVGRFIVEIDGDGAVVSRLCSCYDPWVTPEHPVSAADAIRCG